MVVKSLLPLCKVRAMILPPLLILQNVNNRFTDALLSANNDITNAL